MKSRCFNPANHKYKDYGARGIKVCEWWLKFENFFADMGARPSGMTIERKDNDGNYEPTNCKWATREEQQNNRRANVLLTARGKTLTLAQWLVVPGANRLTTIRGRLTRGWGHEDAIFVPLDSRFGIKSSGQLYLTAKGKTLSVLEWSRISKIKQSAIYTRISRGWPVEKAIFTPAWGWRNG
jgi:hypothetical protein